MENCCFYEECKNKDNFKKCSRCENNPENFEIIEKMILKAQHMKDEIAGFIFIRIISKITKN